MKIIKLFLLVLGFVVVIGVIIVVGVLQFSGHPKCFVVFSVALVLSLILAIAKSITQPHQKGESK